MTDAVRAYRERLLDLVVNRSDVRMNGAVQYVPRGKETLEIFDAALAELQAEAEARRWEWVAKHTYVCPLGEMKPGEPGSYVIEVRPSDALLARYEEVADD